MRKRALLVACALGVGSLVGFAPQAQAVTCTSIRIYDAETRCVEDIYCDLVLRHPALCPLN